VRVAFGWLRPTRLKLLFVIEWGLFVLIAWMRGSLGSVHQALVALYPLGFFYLIACGLAAWSRRVQRIAANWRLVTGALALTGLDQAAKTIIVARLPLGASVPLVSGWLHLAHRRNAYGSWVLGITQPQAARIFLLVLVMVAVLVLLGSLASYRYYVRTHRPSLWAGMAFVGLFAALASWLIDMALRGCVVDYIELPGLVVADLKDIWLTVGIASLFAEALENPQLSWHWQGWRREGQDAVQLGRKLLRFSVQELCRMWRGVERWWGRG
jgi:lipoprotein signal peptidase